MEKKQTATIATELSLDAWIETGLISVQDFSTARLQRPYPNSSIAESSGWWGVVVVFTDFFVCLFFLCFFFFFFQSALWTAMKRSTLDFLTEQEHQSDLSVS